MTIKHYLLGGLSAAALFAASGAFAQDAEPPVELVDPYEGEVIVVEDGEHLVEEWTGEDDGAVLEEEDGIIGIIIGDDGVVYYYGEEPGTLEDGGAEEIESRCGGCELQTVGIEPNWRGAPISEAQGEGRDYARTAPTDNMCNYAPLSATAWCEAWRAGN